jgi:hypothetical protein
MKKIILISLVSSLLFSETHKCDSRTFFTILINSGATAWYPPKPLDNIKRPLDELFVSKTGVVSIITTHSDPNPVFLGLTNFDFTPTLEMVGGRQYTYDSGLHKRYFDKRFLLKPYKNDCFLNKIILEVILEEKEGKAKKEVYLLTRNKKSIFYDR